MIKPSREQSNEWLIKRQWDNSSLMFLVNPFLFISEGIRENKVAIQSCWSQKLQFWHGHHIHYHFVMTIPVKTAFCFCFQVPNVNLTIFLSAIQQLIDPIPFKAIDLVFEMMFQTFIRIFGLHSEKKTVAGVSPSSDKVIVAWRQNNLILFIYDLF